MLDDYRLPVTDQGVVVPKVWFGQATEVVLRNENGQLTLEPVTSKPGSDGATPTASPIAESIWDLGSDPILDDPISDSSVNHDQYLYGQKS
jgi:hypothetical protein